MIVFEREAWTEVEGGKIRYRSIIDGLRDGTLEYEFEIKRKPYWWGHIGNGKWISAITTDFFDFGLEYCKHELGMK